MYDYMTYLEDLAVTGVVDLAVGQDTARGARMLFRKKSTLSLQRASGLQISPVSYYILLVNIIAHTQIGCIQRVCSTCQSAIYKVGGVRG